MDSIDKTLEDRNARYNSGEGHTRNCALAFRLRDMYRYHTALTRGREMDEFTMEEMSHDHCIEMVLAKIARIATGTFVEDNYHDIQGYTRLALADMFSRSDSLLCDNPNPTNETSGCNLRNGHRGHCNWPTKAYNAKRR